MPATCAIGAALLLFTCTEGVSVDPFPFLVGDAMWLMGQAMSMLFQDAAPTERADWAARRQFWGMSLWVQQLR